MKPEYHLLRLGARYERACLQRDYQTMIRLEGEFGACYADPAVTFDPGTWFIRGRNFIRRQRGLEEVAPW